METDREIAERAIDSRTRAKDYPLMVMPSYRAWSERKLDEGESPAFIANLDAHAMWLLPEEVANVGESEFEEMLAEVKANCGE